MSSIDNSSDDSSDRSYGDPVQHSFCVHQSRRLDGRGCSKFLDCPAHTTRRRTASAGSRGEEEDEGEGAGEGAGEDIDKPGSEDADTDKDQAPLDGSPHAQAALLLGPDEPVDWRASEAASQQSEVSDVQGASLQGIDLTTPSPPLQRQGESSISGPSRAPSDGEGQTQGGGQQVEGIDLTDDSLALSPTSGPRPRVEGSSEERALPTIPASAGDSHASVSPTSQRRPVAPPSPPPPTRRRTSRSASGTAPATSTMQAPRPSAARRPSELVLPRWQPDVEVTFCPICRTQFSFLSRKHHCRKCGRVVCARCSPHRITIPYQYIVQPPGTPRPGAQQYPASLISGEGGHADFSSLGGGEKVRLCNPCVPDPNTNPPESQGSPSSIRGHGRSQSSVGTGGAYGSNSGPSQPDLHFDAYVRSRSATMLPSVSRQTSGGRFYQPTQSRILSGTPPSAYPHTHATSPFGSYRAARHHSVYDAGQASSSSSSSAAARRRPLPPEPPQLAEEDECPICHRELPPRSLANFEEIREAHINTCITSHSTYGGPSTNSRPRRTGMFPYVATEKDCVDSAECTICLEEFEVGVPMARLECLCRFHRDCISRWFAKNPGRCPVHSHDGHGF